MKYFLLYERNQVLRNGDEVRLELHKAYPDDFSLYPVSREIGDVLVGLHLDIEGGMDDIDTPIVKTSLTFSVVDAPELNDYKIKAGDWEEFYTSDATGWKVILLGRRKGESEFRAMWGGYVTPDSYTETLQHHGVVTITARDNIGHLQDFEFDAVGNAEGMITPLEILTLAWEKAQIPMTLGWRGMAESNIWPQTGGVDAIDTYINVSAFEGKTWYDAVTETLYSLGLVLRYVGMNVMAVSPLRRMPTQTAESVDDLPGITPLFTAYGTRELVPAVKEITEEVGYDVTDGAEQPLVSVDDFTGEEVPCIVNAKDMWGEVTQKTIRVNPIPNAGDIGWGNIPSNTLFFNPSTHINSLFDKKAAEEQMFLATNTVDRMVWFGKAMQLEDIVLRIERGITIQSSLVSSDSSVGRITNALFFDAITLRVVIKLTAEGIEKYYDGNVWGTSYNEIDLQFDESGVIEKTIQMENLGSGLLQLFIIRVDVDWKLGYPADGIFGTGAYLGIKSLNFSLPQTRSLMEKNKVTTKYNEANNVRMTRSPELGPAYDEVAFPALIKNAIFRKEGDVYKTATEWVWPYEDYDAAQLAVLVHKELLCYHSKVNNLLTGDIVNADMIYPRTIWKWKGKEHLLLSGSYNFLSSQLEGASLREFVRYEKMWLPHTDIDVAEVSYTGGSVTVKFIADDRVSWNVTTPEWILPSVRTGSGTADILLFVQSSRIGREGLVQIGPAVVKVIQKAVGDFNTDYNDDFKVFRDFNGDYYIGDIN